MHNSIADFVLRSNRRWVFAGLLGLALAWGIAHLGARLTASSDPTIPSSIVYRILAVGFVPWLMQWASVSVLLAPFARWFLMRRSVAREGTVLASTSDDQGSTLSEISSYFAAIAIPLVVGGLWWGGLLVTGPQGSPLDAFTSAVLYQLERTAGNESFGAGIVHEVLGPLTCPFKLAGPMDMRGSDFVWSLASTAWGILLWLFAVSTVTSARERDAMNHELQLRQTIGMACAVVLYTAPVLARALVRLADRVW